jgi:hypothetical protein
MRTQLWGWQTCHFLQRNFIVEIGHSLVKCHRMPNQFMKNKYFEWIFYNSFFIYSNCHFLGTKERAKCQQTTFPPFYEFSHKNSFGSREVIWDKMELWPNGQIVKMKNTQKNHNHNNTNSPNQMYGILRAQKASQENN